MQLLGSTKARPRVGVLIEVGSGSVAVSIVAATDGQPPQVLWSKREVAVLKTIANLQEAAKLVTTSLVNLMLEFDTAGRRAMAAAGSKRVQYVECTIAAPWAYTIPKQIQYRQEQPFTVTDELLHELVQTAVTKTTELIDEQAAASELGLVLTTRATTSVLLNGYQTSEPTNQQATELTLLHTTVTVQETIYEALSTLQQKLFPSAMMTMYSRALMLQCVSSDIAPHNDVAILDITHECTELSISRDQALTHVTYLPFGIYTIAREYAAALDIPRSEALAYLRTEAGELQEKLSKAALASIEAINEAYINRLAELLHSTGDELVSPRNVVLYADVVYEGFFHALLTTASLRTIKSEAVIDRADTLLYQKASKETKVAISDTATLPAIHFFHTANQCFTITKE